jgi:hypothetical protein
MVVHASCNPTTQEAETNMDKVFRARFGHTVRSYLKKNP